MKNIIIATIIGLSFVAGFILGRPSLSDYSKLSNNFDICKERNSILWDIAQWQDETISYPDDYNIPSWKENISDAFKKLDERKLDYIN